MFVFSCLPGYAQQRLNIHVEKAGTLGDLLPNADDIEFIKITGYLNDIDFEAFQKLKYHEFSLDLSEAIFDEIPYRAFYGSNFGLPLREIVLPESLTSISEYAFNECRGLTVVDLSRCSNLKFVGTKAFSWCRNLLSIDFSTCYELKYLGGYSWNGKPEQFLTHLIFEECSKLQEVILPPNLEVIGVNAFFSANYPTILSRIEIPATVRDIQAGAFAGNKLTEIKMKGVTPPCEFYGYENETGNHPFDGVDLKKCILRVPLGCKGSYKSARVWKDFFNIEEYDPNEGSLITHTILVSYNEGGYVKLNNDNVENGSSTSVTDQTDVQLLIKPYSGYYLKQLMVGNIDMIKDIKNNILTILSVTKDQTITAIFEKETPVTYTVKVTYSGEGSVKVNNQSISSNQSTTVTASTDVKITITPLVGYHIKQVQLGNDDVTGQLNNNILTISSISTDKDIKVIFEKDASITHSVKVTYSAGGSVKVNNQSVTSGQSATVTASTDVKVTITSQIGYHIKQVRLGTKDVTNQLENNVLTISSILENEEITVAFELNIHTINVTYNESGTVQVDGLSVVSEQSVKVNALSNVKIMITPQTGYHIKQVLLDNKDVFSQLNNNVLTLSSITANKELIITFEKDAPINHTIKLAYSSGGSVKVNDQSLMSGQSFTVAASTDVKVTLTPQSGYRIRQIKLGSEDVTNQLSNNILTISAISANVELSISFEQIPTYKLNISMTEEAGSIKIGDKVITESTLISDIKEESSICINFQPSKYYNIKSIILEDKDITDQIQNGSYTIESMKSNLTLKIEYIRKQYALLIDIQGTDKIKINGKDVTNGSSIIINSGYNRIDISSEYYLIKQVLLDNKIINEGSGSYIEISMDSDKKLTIIAELREKREVSLTSEEPGTLASHLSEEDMKMVTDLNISGEIDQRDFLVLNQMQSLYKLSLRVTIGEYKNYPANTIPENAFHNNKTIKMIYLSNSIEAIGKQAFLGSAISYIEKYAENYKYLTKIGEESFKDCQCLTQIPSLYNISVIEKGTFENCSNLTTLSTVLTNLKEIKEAAFRNCKNLSITLESGLERIGDYAFENVKNVEIPRGEDTKIELSHIGINALKGCQEDMFNFDNYHNLKELPCFEGCNKLASVTFPPNVKEIPEGTFKGCTSLAYVKMNESIERIAENAFIDSKAISELFVPVNTTPEIYANSFSDLTYYVAKLLVPADQLPFYRNHPVWGKFANIEPIGVATNRQFELSLTAGGFVEIKGDKGIYFDDTFYYEGTNECSYLTSSRIELIITPNQGYLIESVYLNGKNITNELDENNLYVIPYLLVDSKLEVKFKKDNTTGIEMINTDKRVYLSGTNQLSLIGFQVGVHVFIYDAGGRIVRQTMISGSVEKIDLPGRGIYFIRVDKDTFKIAF